ncbi:hypothetical protein BDQ12DRAFT_678126 [Crucibulum laeve]|uniref:Uncharacterized protein n=1 Tax=Crucibulum laeve TaxID=68775 RepID=A0A5C3M8D6_9AGAR|nr:hypothetical protein BDQ12DRAFT_678126 [Crucibulum laeve]
MKLVIPVTLLLPVFLLPTLVFATVNGHCTGTNHPLDGICISTSSCSSRGGTSHSGFCPNDPNDIKCCTIDSCGPSGNKGYCTWTDRCLAPPPWVPISGE